LAQIRLVDVDMEGVQHAFEVQLINPENRKRLKAFLLEAETREEKLEWIAAIQKLINERIRKVAAELREEKKKEKEKEKLKQQEEKKKKKDKLEAKKRKDIDKLKELKPSRSFGDLPAIPRSSNEASVIRPPPEGRPPPPQVDPPLPPPLLQQKAHSTPSSPLPSRAASLPPLKENEGGGATAAGGGEAGGGEQQQWVQRGRSRTRLIIQGPEVEVEPQGEDESAVAEDLDNGELFEECTAETTAEVEE
jgi:hypothetical protein